LAQLFKEADRSEIQALDEGVGDVNQRQERESELSPQIVKSWILSAVDGSRAFALIGSL